MFNFFKKVILQKESLKGIAKLMYQDVSEDLWDKENLTKENLDFTIESIHYIDTYTSRLMNTDFGKELLNNHFDNLVARIGAYIGEVIKNQIKQDFFWYESDSVLLYSSKVNTEFSNIKNQSVLYSRKRDVIILPLDMVSEFVEGNSSYSNLITYVEDMIRQNS